MDEHPKQTKADRPGVPQPGSGSGERSSPDPGRLERRRSPGSHPGSAGVARTSDGVPVGLPRFRGIERLKADSPAASRGAIIRARLAANRSSRWPG